MGSKRSQVIFLLLIALLLLVACGSEQQVSSNVSLASYFPTLEDLPSGLAPVEKAPELGENPPSIKVYHTNRYQNVALETSITQYDSAPDLPDIKDDFPNASSNWRDPVPSDLGDLGQIWSYRNHQGVISLIHIQFVRGNHLVRVTGRNLAGFGTFNPKDIYWMADYIDEALSGSQ